MIELARQLREDVTFYVAPSEQLPLPDASVDLAFTTVSFHHWDDRLAGVREVARVLRPTGRFILADVAAPAAVAWLLGDRPYLSPDGRRELLASAGLRVLRHDRSLSRFFPITVAEANPSSDQAAA
jgi:ubiquinone/menaquinone biosynthesis C-methylase UbiE